MSPDEKIIYYVLGAIAVLAVLVGLIGWGVYASFT